MRLFWGGRRFATSSSPEVMRTSTTRRKVAPPQRVVVDCVDTESCTNLRNRTVDSRRRTPIKSFCVPIETHTDRDYISCSTGIYATYRVFYPNRLLIYSLRKIGTGTGNVVDLLVGERRRRDGTCGGEYEGTHSSGERDRWLYPRKRSASMRLDGDVLSGGSNRKT